MPVQVRIVFADSTDTVVSGNNDKNNQLFEFIFSKKPAYLVFDPYRNILLKQATTTLGLIPLQDEKKSRIR
jgi:hypothetical protein